MAVKTEDEVDDEKKVEEEDDSEPDEEEAPKPKSIRTEIRREVKRAVRKLRDREDDVELLEADDAWEEQSKVARLERRLSKLDKTSDTGILEWVVMAGLGVLAVGLVVWDYLRHERA